jgi:hypothetical protein
MLAELKFEWSLGMWYHGVWWKVADVSEEQDQTLEKKGIYSPHHAGNLLPGYMVSHPTFTYSNSPNSVQLPCYLRCHLQTFQNIYNIIDPPAFGSQLANSLVQWDHHVTSWRQVQRKQLYESESKGMILQFCCKAYGTFQMRVLWDVFNYVWLPVC